jgi:hypothetical protein
MGGFLLQHGYTPKAIFLMATVPAAISMLCSVALMSRDGRARGKAIVL